MSQYSASTPSDGQVRPEIKEFFETFFKISDTPDAHELYSEQFTKNGKLIMGPNEGNGRAGKLHELIMLFIRFFHLFNVSPHNPI